MESIWNKLLDVPTSGSTNTIIKPETGENVDSCRVCMTSHAKMQLIFNTGREDIISRIHFCTGLKFTQQDGYPNHICNTCLENLSVAHQFKSSCLLAEETFRKLIKYRIKLEKPDDGDCFNDTVHYDDDVDEVKVKDEILDVLKQNNVRIKRSRLRKKKDKKKLDIKIKPTLKTQKRPYNKISTQKNKLLCEPCDIKFTSKEEFDDHKKVLHKDETWMCEICGKVFIHRGSHYTHVRSHMPPKYACEHCDYKTWHKYDLVKHVRIHTGVKQYQCEFCTASFHTSSNLTGHIRRFHEGIKRFQCHMCDRSFYDRTKLNRHLDSHNDIKRYECQVCHACFTRRCYWKKHLHRQHGVVIPAQRPGRQKVNLQIGGLESDMNSVLEKSAV